MAALNNIVKPAAPAFIPRSDLTTKLYKAILTLIFMAVLFGTAFLIAYATQQKNSSPASYDQCTRAKGSIISKTYPAVCKTKGGQEFKQPLSEEEQKLLESPFDQNNQAGAEGKFCGGIAGLACPEGYTCKLEGSYPDAGGKCTKK